MIKCLRDYDYEIYGEVDNINYATELQNFKNVKIKGVVSRDEIKDIFKKNKKYIFVSLEINTACPNSVIEALNFGIPVLGYNSGSMSEIIDDKIGRLIEIDKNFQIKNQEVIEKVESINKEYTYFNQNLKNLNKKFTLDFMSNEYVNEISKT